MNDITAYEHEIMKLTDWTIQQVRELLSMLQNDTLSPAGKQYYLEKISPF